MGEQSGIRGNGGYDLSCLKPARVGHLDSPTLGDLFPSIGVLMVRLIALTAAVALLCFIVHRYWQPIRRTTQWLVATVLLFGSLALGVALGTVTELVLPGIGGIVLGSSTGALLGWLTFLLAGTFGIATGGTAFALGGGALTAIFAIVGCFAATTAGFGVRTVHQWVIALPVLILALGLFARGRHRAKPVPGSPVQQALLAERIWACSSAVRHECCTKHSPKFLKAWILIS